MAALSAISRADLIRPGVLNETGVRPGERGVCHPSLKDVQRYRGVMPVSPARVMWGNQIYMGHPLIYSERLYYND